MVRVAAGLGNANYTYVRFRTDGLCDEAAKSCDGSAAAKDKALIFIYLEINCALKVECLHGNTSRHTIRR